MIKVSVNFSNNEVLMDKLKEDYNIEAIFGLQLTICVEWSDSIIPTAGDSLNFHQVFLDNELEQERKDYSERFLICRYLSNNTVVDSRFFESRDSIVLYIKHI